MLRKLLHGFMFGIGFAAAVALAIWVATTIQFSSIEKVATEESRFGRQTVPYEEQARWRELAIQEKLEEMSGAALLRFREEPDRLMAAYVDKVVTRDSSITVPYSVGDRVESSDYYAKNSPSSNRDGILLMYSGNPPREMEGAYLYQSRLVAHGDMPLEVFFGRFTEVAED